MATKHTLLIVDDEPQILKAYSARLAQDYRVLTAEGAEDALQIFNREDIHIVLTDQRMPVVSGVSFLRRLRTEHPDTVRLLWTGFQDLGEKGAIANSFAQKGAKGTARIILPIVRIICAVAFSSCRFRRAGAQPAA